MTIALVFDAVVVVLLAAAIGYAVELNRKLTALRRDRAELEGLASKFAAAAQSAEAAIGQLKATSETAGRTLEQATVKAQALRDDLNFLIERGEPLADRMTSGISAGIRQSAAAPAAAATPSAAASVRAAAPAQTPAAPSAAEIDRDLRRALANLR